jgi:hypothetical protein
MPHASASDERLEQQQRGIELRSGLRHHGQPAPELVGERRDLRHRLDHVGILPKLRAKRRDLIDVSACELRLHGELHPTRCERTARAHQQHERDRERRGGERPGEERTLRAEQAHESERSREQQRPASHQIVERAGRCRLREHPRSQTDPGDREHETAAGPPSHQTARGQRWKQEEESILDRQQRLERREWWNDQERCERE